MRWTLQVSAHGRHAPGGARLQQPPVHTLFGSDARPLPDVAPFLHAIQDQPGEDTHRLVLADFLQERGDVERGDEEHARLIRLQCERSRTAPYSPRWFELEFASRALLAFHRDRLTDCPGHKKATYERFERGFPTAIRVPGATLLRGTDPAFAVGTVDGLAVDAVRSVAALIRQPQLGRATALALERVHPGDLGRLITEGDVARVRRWSVQSGALANGDANALWGAVDRGAMTVPDLDLGGQWSLGEPSVEPLTEIARRMRGGRLRLAGTYVGGPVLLGLTSRPPADADHGIHQLILDITGGRLFAVGDEHLLRLAQWPGARHLEFLSVVPVRSVSSLSDLGVEALAGSVYLSGLRVLRLNHGRITDRGLAALAQAPLGWDLRWVSLIGTRVTPAGVAAFHDRFPGCRVDLQHWEGSFIT